MRTHYRRSRPTAEQERNIPQAVLFGAQAANSRRDRTQDIPRGTYDRRRTNARHLDRTARKTFREKHMTGIRQTTNIPIEPHNRRDSSSNHTGEIISQIQMVAPSAQSPVRVSNGIQQRGVRGHPHPSADDTFPCRKPGLPSLQESASKQTYRKITRRD